MCANPTLGWRILSEKLCREKVKPAKIEQQCLNPALTVGKTPGERAICVSVVDILLNDPCPRYPGLSLTGLLKLFTPFFLKYLPLLLLSLLLPIPEPATCFFKTGSRHPPRMIPGPFVVVALKEEVDFPILIFVLSKQKENWRNGRVMGLDG